MINSIEELRIGNKVKCLIHNQYAGILGLNQSTTNILLIDQSARFYESKLDNIEGIAIDDEILKKAGFGWRKEPVTGHVLFSTRKMKKSELKIAISPAEDYRLYIRTYDDEVTIKKIKFLHELQNIYSELNNEKIDI